MKKTKLFMMLALFIIGVVNSFAQNVTISPTTGNLIAALTSGNEQGFENGWSAMWRHEQLPLSFTVSDENTLTDAGEIKNPAGNVRVHDFGGTLGKKLIVAGGTASDSYSVLSLPKGYRITGYKLVLVNNLNYVTIGEGEQILKPGYALDDWGNYTNTQRSISKVMCETDKTYETVFASSETMGGSNSNNEYVIERYSQTEDDMGNQLYFRLKHTNENEDAFYAVTIKSFEVWFTAEGTFSAELKPSEMGQARSVVSAPFQTSKIDLGDMKVEEKNNQTFFAYNYQNVRDLTGYNTIYQSKAIANGVPAEGSEAKTIYPVKVDGENRYAFGNNTYFVETPVMVHTQTGLEAPVGYRIVGARFNYLWGKATQGGTQTKTNYYVTYTSGETTYYLNDQLHFSTNKFAWSYDSNTGGLYTGSGDNIRYLSCTATYQGQEQRPLTFSSDANGNWNLEVFTRNGSTYLGWSEWNTFMGGQRQGYVTGTTNAGSTVYMQRNNGAPNNAARVTSETETETIPSFTPGNYTLKVYDKTGTTVEKTINVTQSNAGGIYELEGLNNDAVKFEIADLDPNKQALVAITLDMQFLNPYIDKMNIVCHDPLDQFTLTQTFTANDFAVAGGKFEFFVPKSKANSELTLTFSDLYSKYGDDTYDHVSNENPGNSRYSFVKSQHHNVLGDDIYSAKTEAASATMESERLSSKQNVRTKVATAGNIRWKFNNAEDLGNNQTGTGHLEETPFTLAGYLASTDPDAKEGETPAQGQFIPCKLKASDETQKSGIYYVFTTDETRYNIAPTTAWQHRYYAFYRMDIELKAEDFNPIVTPVEVYDTTYYRDANDNRAYLPQYGVKLSTKETITIDDGNGGTKQSKGYLTAGQIGYQLNQLKKTNNINPDQILYIDGSELLSIVEIGDSTISKLKKVLGKNALIFLPENTSSTLDNFAFKTQSGTFRAGNNIVITDKQPFFSPYDIQIDNANFAMYDRKITTAQNGKVYNATIVLPFTIDLNDDNQHVNPVKDENGKTIGAPFSLYTMADKKELKKVKEFDNEVVQFFELFEGKESEANRPYVVHVYGDGEDKDSNHSFKVRCKGSLVVATGDPNAASFDNTKSGYCYNETADGTYDGARYSFKHTGTYRGYTFNNAGDPATKEQIFYFAEDCFYTSKTLHKNEPMYVQPFRSYYDYTTTSSGAKLTKFRLAFSDIDDFGGTNGIDEIKRDVDLAVIPGKGAITLMARADKDVTIHAVNGMTVDKCNLRAGETRTVSVPAGVYVINGVKMVVK